MVTDNGMITTIAPIEGLSDPNALSLTTQEIIHTIATTAGARTPQERREFIVLGKDPDTGEELSLREHHYKLIMMSASDKEWASYHERARKVYAL